MGGRNITLTAGRAGADVNGPLQPPHYGGDGDSDAFEPPGYYERRRRYRLGVLITLSSVATIFIVLCLATLWLHAHVQWDPRAHVYYRTWVPFSLPLGLLLVNTAILLASSLTLEVAHRSAMHAAVVAPIADIPGVAPPRDRSVLWTLVTLALASIFLGGQIDAWRRLQQSGIFMRSGTSHSLFYLLTGAHGLHLLGGMFVLAYAAGTAVL